MNPRLQKTKDSLLQAMIRMLENKALDAITVSDLCKEAGINRTTFYKYYSVPEDVIMEAVENMLDNVIYSSDKPQKTNYDHMLACCNAFYQNRNLMSVYVRSKGNIGQMLQSTILRYSGKLGFLTNTYNNFAAGGVAAVLAAWMMRDFPESPEEMAQTLTECISKLFSE
jgi:AcrR family transcriptional regulator